MNERNFHALFLENVLVNGNYLKNKNSAFVENYCIFGFDFSMTVTHNESPTGKAPFWTFASSFAYMVNSLFLSLDIPVTINILREIIKILHEQMLKSNKFVLIP